MPEQPSPNQPCESCPFYTEPRTPKWRKVLQVFGLRQPETLSPTKDCPGPITVSRGTVTKIKYHGAPKYDWQVEAVCDRDADTIVPEASEQPYDPTRPTIVLNDETGARAAAFIKGNPEALEAHKATMALMRLMDASYEGEDLSDYGVSRSITVERDETGTITTTEKTYDSPPTEPWMPDPEWGEFAEDWGTVTFRGKQIHVVVYRESNTDRPIYTHVDKATGKVINRVSHPY